MAEKRYPAIRAEPANPIAEYLESLRYLWTRARKRQEHNIFQDYLHRKKNQRHMGPPTSWSLFRVIATKMLSILKNNAPGVAEAEACSTTSFIVDALNTEGGRDTRLMVPIDHS